MTSVLYDAPGPRARRLSRILSWVIGVVVVGLLVYTGITLAQQGLFGADRWDVFSDPLVWIDLVSALGVNVSAAAVAAIGAILLGMVFSLLRSSELKAVRIPATVVLEFFRGLPVLLLMLFILLVFQIDPFASVVIALILYNGTIIGEALRSGLQSLPRGQREAGLAIGLSGLKTRLLIEFPQAFRNMLPIIIAQLVVLLKDTSLGYIVGLLELLRRGRLSSEFFGAGTYAFSFFVVVLAMFLAVNLALSFLARYVAKRLDQPPPDLSTVTDAAGGGTGGSTGPAVDAGRAATMGSDGR